MRKFNVGDRVKVIAAKHADKLDSIGAEFEITSHDGNFHDNREPAYLGREPFRWRESELELVQQSPIRTVTRKEIVPGTYGRIDVTGTYQGNRVTLDWTGNESIHSAPAIAGLDAAELRAAADVFTQLADALEDQK